VASGSSNLALELIRASTREAHLALEESLEIARPDACDEAYGRYLAAVLGWLEPLEGPLWSSPWPEPIVAASRRDKCTWIKSDLRARGLSERDVAHIPRRTTLPPLATPAERFGVAYVVEGSQLGGRALLPRLGPRLAPHPTRWLHGYGDASAAHWKTFVAALGASLGDAGDARVAAASARATFEWVHAWFNSRGVA
jgi:heme oxygenase